MPGQKRSAPKKESKKAKKVPKSNKVQRDTLTEVFNADKLAYILKSPEIKKMLEESCASTKKNPKPKDLSTVYKVAEKYLAKSVANRVHATYYQKGGKGRRYAYDTCSLQTLKSEIRHTIADGKWKDIDMKSAGPVIIAFMCKDQMETPCLNDYNENKEELLKTLEVPRDIGKKCVNSLLYGGNYLYDKLKIKPEWIRNLREECRDILKLFATHDDFEEYRETCEAKGKEENIPASFLSYLSSDMEDNILMEVYKYFGEPEECVFCFDGLMIRSDIVVDFKALNAHISAKMGFKIQFVEKPMDKILPIPDNIPKYVSPPVAPGFNFEDKYIYQDFVAEFANSHYNSFESLDRQVSAKYKKVVGRCLLGVGSFYKKMQDNIDMCPNLKTCGFDMSYMTEGENPLTMHISLHDFIKRKNGCNQYECILDPESVNPRNFNTWTGFLAKRIEFYGRDIKIAENGLDLIKQFIYDVICSQNEYLNRYVISWLSGLVRNLKGKNEIALVLQSVQGTGKSFLFRFIKEFVIGTSNVSECSGVEAVTTRFNTFLQGKRLIIVNEMSGTRDNFLSGFDKMKALITDQIVEIEPKGVNIFPIKNILNFVLMTNHKNAIVMEPGDRRYQPVGVSKIHLKDRAYFANLEANCFNQQTGNAFYMYLLDLPEQFLVPLDQVIETELRQDMQEISKPNTQRFVEDLEENGTIVETRSATDLYEEYVDYCKTHGEFKNIINQCRFGIAIKEFPTIEKTGRNYRCKKIFNPKKIVVGSC